MNVMQWGEDPELSGPRNWFRESLMIHEVLNHFRKGKILDFGCGSGNLLIRLVKMGFSGIGIDVSPSAISYFNNQIARHRLQRSITTIIGTDKSLTQGEYRNNFDVIVCGETLEHIKNDIKTVEGFSKVLKRGGICVVSVPAHMYLWDENDDFSSHYRRYERDNLEKIFTGNGFTIVNVYYWGFPLSLLWHRIIYLRMIRKKRNNKKFTNSPGIIGYLLSKNFLKKFLSIPFWIDQLFNWARLGGSLILVAKKV